ncbi:MAG: hypothetical protein HY962_09135 [Ignavibacteriae bacterium]|nr:hypothetical protein [Ignavibacteriota bacterium]
MKAREEAMNAVKRDQTNDRSMYHSHMERQHKDLQQIHYYQQKTYEKMEAILDELRSAASRSDG